MQPDSDARVAKITWAKNADDLEMQTHVVSPQGLVSVTKDISRTEIVNRPDYNKASTHAFVVRTTSKTLYLCASSEADKNTWVRGLAFLLQG